MISWDTCRRDFEQDGALRDIYVQGTTIQHWRLLFDLLRREYGLELLVYGTPRSVTPAVDEVFIIRDTANPMLRVRAGGIVVYCHFFTTDEIELDIDPREITSQVALDELLGFLQRVGDAVGRKVILCYESDEQHPFITYEPSRKEFAYHAYGDYCGRTSRSTCPAVAGGSKCWRVDWKPVVHRGQVTLNVRPSENERVRAAHR